MIDLEPAPAAAAPHAVVLREADARRARRRVRVAAVAFALLLLAAVTFLVFPREGGVGGVGGVAGDFAFLAIEVSFAVAGFAILRKQATNVIGWILVAIAFGWLVGSVLEFYADLALTRDLPGGAIALSVSSPLWAPPVVLMGVVLLLRFPNGELPSPRWRIVEWIALVAVILTFVAVILVPTSMAEFDHPELDNPLGIEALAGVLEVLTAVVVVIPVLIIASAIALVRRYRRSSGVERLQMKWLVAAGAAVALAYLVAMAVSFNVSWLASDTPRWIYVLQAIATYSFVLIPVAIGFAILRYKLYGIDVVINKAFVYGSLAAFITVMYVGIVVGLGHLIGSERSPGLSILATAMVAVAFQPVRTRVQRVANRIVYGKRAAPYDVLSNLSSRMTGSFGTDEVLPRVARLLVDGTGAARVEIWLRVGERLRLAASSPSGDDGMTDLIGVSDTSVPAIPNATTSVPVRDEGELLGVIALRKDAGDAMTPPEQALTADVARQAALLLRNVRLIEELRASRERIVAAQDDERRRLERDIHDGAQQQLVTLSLATRLAESGLGPDAPQPLTDLLERAVDESKQALAELRELARGIHPRILTERGLPAAIRSLAERAPVPVTVEAAEGDRLPEPIEATAYFAVSEALQNIAKYAQASAVEVRTFRENGTLVVRVSDDGVGGADPSKGSGLRGLLDRVDAVGGRLDVHSPDGEGTRVTISLPVAERSPALAGAG
jgi:signal transduction histidine kinase